MDLLESGWISSGVYAERIFVTDLWENSCWIPEGTCKVIQGKLLKDFFCSAKKTLNVCVPGSERFLVRSSLFSVNSNQWAYAWLDLENSLPVVCSSSQEANRERRFKKMWCSVSANDCFECLVWFKSGNKTRHGYDESIRLNLVRSFRFIFVDYIVVWVYICWILFILTYLI